DAIGIDQDHCLAESMRGLPTVEVVASDLARAAETARIVAEALGSPLRLDPALRERSFGDWEGLTFEDLFQRSSQDQVRLGLDAFHVRPPGGESFADVWDRLGAIVEQLFSAEGDRLVVGHGGANALMLARLLKGSLETSRAFRFGNASLSELQRRPDGLFQLVRYNDTSHLTLAGALSGGIDGASR
ncbi:MAG: histidine phosphatase family protein, partial [Fimbriimonas ginsengisoli]|nr:histidine phosphatase family protein [Fimbriimonas ginsengisoli]